jgi:hypothetical protein
MVKINPQKNNIEILHWSKRTTKYLWKSITICPRLKIIEKIIDNQSIKNFRERDVKLEDKRGKLLEEISRSWSLSLQE